MSSSFLTSFVFLKVFPIFIVAEAQNKILSSIVSLKKKNSKKYRINITVKWVSYLSQVISPALLRIYILRIVGEKL